MSQKTLTGLERAIHDRYLLAQTIALHAAQFGYDFFRRRDQLKIEAKGGNPQDMVTMADCEVEAYVRRCVGEVFPEDAVMGEEQGGEQAGAEYLWIIDPIDGTACFVNGMYSWCISVCVVRNGETIIGVVYDPNAHEMFHAKKGNGAFCGPKPMHVHSGKTLKEGVLGVGTSFRIDNDVAFIPFLQKVLQDGGMFMRNGSGALMISYVAAGRMIGYFEPHQNSWDALAGMLLVKEAGGFGNDYMQNDGLMRGNPVMVGNRDIVEILSKHTGIGVLA